MTVERCWYGCPNDWTLFRESCYYFNRNKKHGSFLDAKAECEDLGGYLVEIESKEEDDFIIDTVSFILIVSIRINISLPNILDPLSVRMISENIFHLYCV